MKMGETRKKMDYIWFYFAHFSLRAFLIGRWAALFNHRSKTDYGFRLKCLCG